MKPITTEQARSLNQVAMAAYENAAAKGFHDGEQIGVVSIERMGVYVANLQGEVSELWEAARKGNLNKQCDKDVVLTCAQEELADIVIRAYDTAVALGIDIGEAVAAKHGYNLSRAHKHGKLA